MQQFRRHLRRRQGKLDEVALVDIDRFIEKTADPAVDTLRDQTYLMVRKLLPTGRCNLATVAGHFYVSVRTLQRRLEQDGLVFEDLVDAARRAGAEQYLIDPAMQISQVAGLLGYTTPSSFTHAFRRWHGLSPREWRKLRLPGSR